MSFQSGSVTFRAMNVIGDLRPLDQMFIDSIASQAFAPSELGVPEDYEYGWSGGRHLYDGEFSFENNVYAGDYVLFALRIDCNKVPNAVKMSYTATEQAAVAKFNPSGFLSKVQRQEVKETVRAKCEDEQRSGKYRRSRLVPVLLNTKNCVVYTPATGQAAEFLHEIFERTFKCELCSQTAGVIASSILGRSKVEPLRGTRFVLGPEGDDQYPEYPWVAKGAEPKDFLGNEFLLWLAHISCKSGMIGNDSIFFDRAIAVDCAYGQTGKDSIHGDSSVRCPEFLEAMRTGKVPRKAGMLIDANNAQFSFTFGSEMFSFAGVRLPEVEDAENPRTLLEARIALIETLVATVIGIYSRFLADRSSPTWDQVLVDIQRWILVKAA